MKHLVKYFLLALLIYNYVKDETIKFLLVLFSFSLALFNSWKKLFGVHPCWSNVSNSQYTEPIFFRSAVTACFQLYLERPTYLPSQSFFKYCTTRETLNITSYHMSCPCMSAGLNIIKFFLPNSCSNSWFCGYLHSSSVNFFIGTIYGT